MATQRTTEEAQGTKLGESWDHFLDDRNNRWSVHVQWALIDGKAEPIEVTLRSAASALEIDGPIWPLPLPLAGREVAHPITAQAVRSLPLGEIFGQLRAKVADNIRAIGHKQPELTIEALKAADAWGSRRGTALTTEALEEVATVYRNAVLEGLDPIPVITKRFNISRSAAAKRVMKARDKGLLGPAQAGRAGEAKR